MPNAYICSSTYLFYYFIIIIIIIHLSHMLSLYVYIYFIV